MSNNVIKGAQEKKRPYRGIETAAGIFALTVLCIFPFVIHDKYFDILPTKYRFYATVSVAVLVFTAIYLIASGAVARGVKAVRDGSWIRRFDLTDWCALAFSVMIIVSTLQSEFRFEAFWGNEGRYTGLFTLLLYVFSYFLISRFLRWKQWYLDAFLGGGILACLWGITDYFKMDIFHFKERISNPESFTSSFGNINTYTIYVAMVIAVAAVLFVLSESVWRTLYYYVCFIIGMFAIIMGESDNAYLSLGILFALLPLYAFRKTQAVRRYVVMAATVLTVAKCIDWINVAYADTVIGINSLFSLISGHDKIMVMIGAAWGTAAVLYLLKLVVKKEPERVLLALRVAWGIMLAAAAAVLLYMFYDANFAGHQDKYQAIAKYIVFNDNWGTNRGFAWRISWENFRNFPLMHKIFGFGPDTFGIITVYNNAQEMSEKYNVIFDNAHNEYLQFLLTIGIAGLAAYAAFLVSAFVKMTRHAKGNLMVLAPMFAFVCYSTQAVVNLSVPITAPFMWLFLAMGLAVCRWEENGAMEQDAEVCMTVGTHQSFFKRRKGSGKGSDGRKAEGSAETPGNMPGNMAEGGSSSQREGKTVESAGTEPVFHGSPAELFDGMQASWAVEPKQKEEPESRDTGAGL